MNEAQVQYLIMLLETITQQLSRLNDNLEQAREAIPADQAG